MPLFIFSTKEQLSISEGGLDSKNVSSKITGFHELINHFIIVFKL